MSVVVINKTEKPTTLDEFKDWFHHKFNYDGNNYPNYYNVATNALLSSFEQSLFWKDIQNELKNINDKYYIQTGYQLLAEKEAPKVCIKSLDSLLIKAFRKNVINNPNFPDEPFCGWITQDCWFGHINDILRTTIVVKYLDGVEFLLREIHNIAQNTGCQMDYSLEAREEGYYAAHAGVKIQLNLIDKSFKSNPQIINVEIQITTELQEIIKNLLHKHYEENRKRTIPKKNMWQWDYHCDEFASNYLGHIVHYVEGMIVEIRDKQNKK